MTAKRPKVVAVTYISSIYANGSILDRKAEFECGRVLCHGARHKGAEVKTFVVYEGIKKGANNLESGRRNDRNRESTNNGGTKVLARADRIRVDGHAGDVQISGGSAVSEINLSVGNSNSNESDGSSEELHDLELEWA
ncbi:hypothetical protein BGX21_001870 [Mortierella sp. AD011]|nr:hypothetical protein BGX20_001957 [Mortierella sp. AD010]KAF9382218.1 hypothetical protein BGX21_001870 [Mortierella sp. AD011]